MEDLEEGEDDESVVAFGSRGCRRRRRRRRRPRFVPAVAVSEATGEGARVVVARVDGGVNDSGRRRRSGFSALSEAFEACAERIDSIRLASVGLGAVTFVLREGWEEVGGG